MREDWPLSPAQTAIWLDGVLNPDASVYNQTEVIVLEGPLDVAALRQARAQAEDGVEALRLRFEVVNGQPRQFLAPSAAVDMPLVDFSHSADPEAAASEEAWLLARRPFDPLKGPLHRHRILRLGPELHHWVRVYHHLVVDGYGARLLMEQCAAAYAALVRGEPAPAPLPGGYLQILAEDAGYVGSAEHQRDVDYWRQRLTTAGPPTTLTRRRNVDPPGPSRSFLRLIDRDLTRRLDDLARQAEVTPHTLLFTAFLLLLAQAAQTRRPLCQTPRLNRRGRRQRAVPGEFATMAPFGLDLPEQASFFDLLAQVNRAQRGDFRHGRLDVNQMIAAGLDPWQGCPPAGIVFNAMDYPHDLPFHGLKASSRIVSTAPVAELVLVVAGQGRHGESADVALYWFFNPARHDEAFVATLARRYEALLAAVAQRPDAPWPRLPAMADDELALLTAWEAGPPLPADLPAEAVHLRFWRQAAQTPEALAVDAADGRFSYAQLATAVAGMARLLQAKGAGGPVGLCVGPSMWLPAGFLAIMAAGGAVTPLDPNLPPQRLGAMIQGVGCRLVLAGDQLRRDLPAETWAGAQVVSPADLGPLDQLSAAGFCPVPAAPDDLACVFHTSGSTGAPKPVAITHGALTAKIASKLDVFGIGPDEVVCASAAIGFDPVMEQIFIPLTSGGALWPPPRTVMLDANEFWRQAAAHGVTYLNMAPSLLDLLLASAPLGCLPALRRVVLGGERLDPALAARVAAILRPRAIWNMYGPTEATVDATGWLIPQGRPHDETPIGRPLPGCLVRLLDDDLRRTPMGAPGEICIGGVGVAAGYLGRDELTAERFVADPYGPPGGRLYRTGDYAVWRPDGVLTFLGRRDDQVKVRGQRLELGEVETALRSLPGVERAAVALRPGGAGDEPWAYVVGSASERDLAQALRQSLPTAAVPTHFVFLPELPLNAAGKVDRQALSRLDDRKPQRSTPSPAVGRSSGADSLARGIAAVWSELLGGQEIDWRANIFEMGVHSLLVVAAQERIGALAGREVTAAEIMDSPTVLALARRLAGGPGDQPRARADVRGDSGGDVAIVGMALRFPGASDRHAFWANLMAGRCSATRRDLEALRRAGAPEKVLADSAFVPVHGWIDDFEHFDPAPLGYSPGEAAEIDPQQRILLEVAWQALEDAGCDPLADGPVGAMVGVGFNCHQLDNLGQRLLTAGLTERYLLVFGNEKDHAATRLAYKLDLTGPVLNVNTSCSSSLTAVAMAVMALRQGHGRVMLAGGVSQGLTTYGGYCHTEGGVASASGVCRPFDATADGIVGGSGAGVVALKRLADALADGDVIHAVIKGVGLDNNGQQRASYSAPTVDGELACLRLALADAGLDPADIGAVEGHGTGTALGDAMEATALNQAFRGQPPGSVVLGSVKGNVGHLDAAAGVCGLIKAVLALGEGVVPPTCNFQRPLAPLDPAVSPLLVSDRPTPWPATPAGQPRRALVSSYGIGGSNVNVVLEQAPPPAAPPTAEAQGPSLLTLSAATPTALETLAQRLAPALSVDADLADAAAILAGRRRLRHRRAVVAASAAEARARLTQADAPGRADGVCGPAMPALALMFPGQGAQRPGMGRGLYHGLASFRRVVDQAVELLGDDLGPDLRDLLLADPADGAAAARLTDTALTQPAMFVLEYALAKALEDHGVRPQALVGHSVGEYVAASLAGVMDFADALGLVARRGQLMASAAKGAMLAVAMAEDEARPLLQRLAVAASLAVVNGPRQCVLAGTTAAIDALEAAVKAMGRPVQRLAVSHAFHCALMDPILEPFAQAVARVTLRPPHTPCLSNLTGDWLSPAEAVDPAYWVRHLRGTVRFADNLAALLAEPNRLLLELGPGQTLTRLARANGAGLESVLTCRPGVDQGPEGLLAVVGALWTRGLEPDRAALWGQGPRRKLALPGYPFERAPLTAAGRPPEPAPVAVTVAAPPVADLAALLRLWQEVLGLESIAPDDDFFALGGDSLTAIRLASRIEERLGLKVGATAIFAERTVAGLATRLFGGAADHGPTVVAAPAREEGIL